jgi:voltage-gated potassium channel Kch
MSALFWIKRYLLAAVPLFVILAAVEWFKGSATRDDYLSAAAWALAAAAIFTYMAWRRFRNAQACGMCNDLPAAGKNKKAP